MKKIICPECGNDRIYNCKNKKQGTTTYLCRNHHEHIGNQYDTAYFWTLPVKKEKDCLPYLGLWVKWFKLLVYLRSKIRPSPFLAPPHPSWRDR